MTEPLFPVQPKLTDRQAYVLQIVWHPIGALQAGVELHDWQGCLYCRPEQPCEYAEQAGREVLEALRKKGLLQRDRHHVYARAGSDGPAADTGTCEPGYDPSTAEIPY